MPDEPNALAHLRRYSPAPRGRQGKEPEMKSDDITRLERSLAEAGARLRGPETQMMEAARAAQRAMRHILRLLVRWRRRGERSPSVSDPLCNGLFGNSRKGNVWRM